MNRAIVENWNAVVQPEDDVYVLGDLMLNNNDEGMRLLKSLKGNIHIILGNHDTDTRIELYNNCYNVVEITLAKILKYNKFRFYLCHYRTEVANLDEAHLSQHLINLYGHTHQKTPFYMDNPWYYNVGVDSHNCTPICIDQIIEECRAKYQECENML
jgi:calcineurin-like phosphoesterase family protein